MPLTASFGSLSAKNLGSRCTAVYQIPASGVIQQFLSLAYAYGNPSTFAWTRSGNTMNYSVSSVTTYCGSTYSTSGSIPITKTPVGNTVIESVSLPTWTHPKDCCAGNRNTIYETYSLTMTSSNTAVLSCISSNGGQTGC